MKTLKARPQGSASLSLPSLAYALLLAVLVAFALHVIVSAGPAARAAAQEYVARAVAEEDRQFCEMFGMRSGTDTFVACSRELANIRQRQVDRDSAAAEGIL